MATWRRAVVCYHLKSFLLNFGVVFLKTHYSTINQFVSVLKSSVAEEIVDVPQYTAISFLCNDISISVFNKPCGGFQFIYV